MIHLVIISQIIFTLILILRQQNSFIQLFVAVCFNDTDYYEQYKESINYQIGDNFISYNEDDP